MNKSKVVGGLIVAILLTTIMVGCGINEPEANQPQYTTVPVERGDVIRTVYVPGELVLTDTLTVSSPVDSELLELLVKPGEKVNTGQVLAKLDASEWEKQLEEQLKELEDQLRAAERQVTTKEHQVTTKERQVTTKERDLLQAEINLRNAKIALEKAQDVYEWPDIRTAQLKVCDAESLLAYAQRNLDKATSPSDIEAWTNIVEGAEAALSIAEARLEAIFSAYDTKEVAIKKLQVELAQGRLEDAQRDIEDAQRDVEDAQRDVEDAQRDVEDAQEALDEALNTSLEIKITAPCDGMVLDIKFNEGDMVTKDSPIIVLANLSQMELRVTIGQDNIISIRPGMSAEINLDALPGTTLKGKVDYMVPQKSATSQTVTYEVYLRLDEVAEGLLPGMTGGATILVAEKHDVLRLPRRLVKIAPDGSGRVEVLEQDQPAFREVVIGVKGDTHYEIVSGLSEGELVIQRGRF